MNPLAPVGDIGAAADLDIRSLANSMAAGVWVIDRCGSLIGVNSAGLAMIGAHSIDEVRAKDPPFRFPVARLEDGSPVPHNCMPLQRVLDGEELVHELEILADVPGGKSVLRVTATPLRTRTGKIVGAIKVAVDVTTEYQLMRVKDEFIRTAAHELKTPLAVISANADVALETFRDGPDSARRPLEGVRRGVERIDRLVSSLLDLLDVQGGLFSFSRIPVHLDEIITRAVARLSDATAARVHIAAFAATTVSCDEPRLRRALASILDNAVKYSDKGTPIDVSVRGDDTAAVIAVRDHGFGIPRDKQPRIFEKYFRAHAGTTHDAGGIGVGLYVAQHIVMQHGGRIWFESIEGEGSTFFVRLPVSGAA